MKAPHGVPGTYRYFPLLLSAFLTSGCGYIAGPVPPLANIPARVHDLAAIQRGTKIVAHFSIPQLTTERRNELAKTAHKYAEGAKIAVRGVRRDGMEQIKGHEKKHEIGEDLAKNWSDEVQKLTDQFIKKVDEALVDKEKDIRQV